MSISQSEVKVILQKFWTRTPTRTRTLDPHPHNSTRYTQPATFTQTPKKLLLILIYTPDRSAHDIYTNYNGASFFISNYKEQLERVRDMERACAEHTDMRRRGPRLVHLAHVTNSFCVCLTLPVSASLRRIGIRTESTA